MGQGIERTVLLVEDSTADAELVKMLFPQHRNRCRFLRSHDGVEALAYLARAQEEGALPDLILLDLNLPIIDGRQVLQKIKAQRALAAIPVMMLTTSETELDRDRCLKLGARGFFSKGPDIVALEQALQGIEAMWWSSGASVG